MRENLEPQGNVFLVDMEEKRLVASLHNVTTETAKAQLATAYTNTSVTWPDYVALGNVNALSTESPREFTALKAEFARVQASNKTTIAPDTARFQAVFNSSTGIGEINEVGLFSAVATVQAITACDATAGWTTGGTNVISLDNSDYREGTGALKVVVGNNATILNNGGLNVSLAGHTEDDYFQCWVYVEDVSDADGIVLSAYTSAASDYYTWTIEAADLADGWNFISKKWSDASTTGTPDIANNIKGIVLAAGQTPTAAKVFKLDMVRAFKETGNMWARGETASEVTKGVNQVIGVYWFISFSEGGSAIQYRAFAEETLTITNASASSLTSSTYSITGQESAKRVTIMVLDQPIRWYADGTAPTAVRGMLSHPWSIITLDGTDIANFQAIRDTTATDNATLVVEYSR